MPRRLAHDPSGDFGGDFVNGESMKITTCLYIYIYMCVCVIHAFICLVYLFVVFVLYITSNIYIYMQKPRFPLDIH